MNKRAGNPQHKRPLGGNIANNVIGNLDVLLARINANTDKEIVKKYQEQYDEIRSRPRVKELIKGTKHE